MRESTAATTAAATAAGESRSRTLRFPVVAATARVAEPVTASIPLPAGALTRPGDWQLFDGASAVPAQCRVLSRWPDGSVRWLFVRAQVDLPGRASKTLSWKIAPREALDPAHEGSAPALRVTRVDGGLRVETGRLAVTVVSVASEGAGLLRDVSLDGTTLPGVVGAFRLAAQEPGQPVAADLPVDAPLAVEQLTVEEEGPLAAVVRLDGWYVPGVWAGRVRLTFHAGKPYVEVAHRFTLLAAGEPRLLRALWLDWSATGGDRDSGSDGSTSQSRLALGAGHYQTRIHSGTEPLEHVLGPRDFFGQEHAAELYFGDYWAAHTGPAGGVAATIFQATQNYPAGYRVEPGQLRAWLVPPCQPLGLVNLPSSRAQQQLGASDQPHAVAILPGVAKTHRLLLHFHPAGTPLEELSFRSLQYQLPDRPAQPSQTYAAAGVWPEPFPVARWEALERTFGQKAENRVIGLGMLDFGDSPDAGYSQQRRGGDNLVWTNNEYDFAHAMYLHWARTGEPIFRGAADASARHWLDVDLCRVSDDPLRLGGHIEHSAQHATGNVTPSHQWVQGLIDYYHHSGEPEALEGAVGVGDNILRQLRSEKFARLGSFQVRELGWALVALANLYVETGDVRYLEVSRDLVQRFMAWDAELGGLLAPYTSHTLLRVPFMIAIAVEGLMRFHAIEPDPRIPALVVREVDALLEECLGPNGLFIYKNLPSLRAELPVATQLGMLAHAYRLTGNRRYLEVGRRQLEWFMQVSPGEGALPPGHYSGAFLSPSNFTPRTYQGSKEFALLYAPALTLYGALADAGMLS